MPQIGHFQYNFPNLVENLTNYVGSDDDEEMLLMAIGDFKNSEKKEDDKSTKCVF